MTEKKGAAKSRLNRLHEMLADAMLEMLEKPEELKGADLNVIRQFLKDNNIEATEDNPQVRKLREKAADVLDFPFNPAKEA